MLKSKEKVGFRKNKQSSIKPGHDFSLVISLPSPATSLSGKAEGLGSGYPYFPVLLQGTDHKVMLVPMPVLEFSMICQLT